jgi:pilus assembly protein TadC
MTDNANQQAQDAQINNPAPKVEAVKPAEKPEGIKGKSHLFIEMLGDRIIPKKHRKGIANYLERADINEVPYYDFGVAAILIFILAIFLNILLLTTKIFSNATIIVRVVLSIIFIPVICIILIVVITFFYKLFLEAKIYHKVRKMEEVFPEFLSELALNMKSGQGLEEALENSVEKEFGYLSEEIEKMCKKVRLGVEIEAAIREFTNNFESDVMEETFGLIITSWKKGASTSHLIDRVYENLATMRFLKRKVIASVTSYRIFLTVVTLVIAPALFALSYHMINLIRSITGQISTVSSNVVFPIAINAVRINDVHFQWFSAIALVLVSVCTSMIISIIKTGSIKEGYKQVVFFAGGTLIIYKLCLILFSYFFSTFNV